MTGSIGLVGEHIAAAARQRGRREHAFTLEPVIGKDILELVSSAMYVDPLTIYREYVQNAADAIDEAFRKGILVGPELGRIDIDLDAENRTIRIRDNGTGLPATDAERILTSFGASQKRGTKARGFRGVGRLAAFGYAQAVTFRAKAKGENFSTAVRWDCRKLKATLLDSEYRGDLRETVRDVVTIAEEDAPNPSAHYFEVVLERVVRIKNDILLNADEVRNYLSEVAPAPFHESFPYANAINELLSQHVAPCQFRMFLNDAPEPITRPHRREIELSKGKSDTGTEIEPILIPNSDGGMLAVGWLLHHAYLGAIHVSDSLRGLRARVGDIQVGEDDLFVDVFPESRFNSWTVGEIHIVDQRIAPNGRRDGFEQTSAFADLHAHLVPIGRDISARCHKSSARRNRSRKFAQLLEGIEAIAQVLSQRGTSKSRSASLRREANSSLAEMKRLAASKSVAKEELATMQKRIAETEARLKTLRVGAFVEDPFAGASRPQRAAYKQVFDALYSAMPSRTAANKLVDKIIAQLVVEPQTLTRGKADAKRPGRKKR